MTQSSSSPTVQFGVYEVDLRAGELRKQGLKVRLQEKPFQVLALLLERPGELVTREELQRKLWPGDTFVDFDHSMNTAVNKLREALGDSAESPRFIETLPKRGYRFIAPVQPSGRAAALSAAPRPRHRPAVVAVVVGLIVVLGLAAYVGWQRWGRRATPPEGRIMLAVLPFENLSGDPEQEYFSDGLTEEMISQLGRVQSEKLGVIARTSAMRYKKTEKGIDEIGRELGVDYVVEGGVRRGSERVRITAQLIQVSDQTKVWSDSFESGESDLLALQSEIARAVVDGIQLKLAPQEQARLARARIVKPEAYEAYLRGRHYLSRGGALPRAIAELEHAVEKEPDYGEAYAALAEAYVFSLPAHETMPKARAAAQKALELDEELASAHMALGLVKLLYDWDWAGVEREFKRALELEPGSAAVHARYTLYLWAMGRVEEAIAEGQRARELDPVSLLVNVDLGRCYYFARRYDEAIEQFHRTLELDRNHYWAHFFLGIAYEQKGMHEEAIAEIAKAREVAGDTELAEAMRKAYAASGYPGALRAWVTNWEKGVEEGRVQPYSVAIIYTRLGEKEKALQWLERAARDRTRALVYLRVEPQFDPIRSDPRFQRVVEQMNFPQN